MRPGGAWSSGWRFALILLVAYWAWKGLFAWFGPSPAHPRPASAPAVQAPTANPFDQFDTPPRKASP